MKKITRLILLAAAFSAPDLAAQQAVTASGGEASGSGGSASISTGQVVYTAISGSGGTATQGVQQPYEIFALGNDDVKGVSVKATVYPNPSVATVFLRIEMASFDNIRYELFDLNGRMLYDGKVSAIETPLSMERFPQATYLLKVYSGASELKSFKIVKNIR